MLAQVASLVATCTDPDGMAALAYLYRHIEAAEAEGLRVKIRSDDDLERTQTRACRGAKCFPRGRYGRGQPLRWTLITYWSPHPWAHISREAIEEATACPSLMVTILEDLHTALRCLRSYRMERLGLEG